MIDLELVRENPDVVRTSQRVRGEDDTIVDRLLDADARRRGAAAAFESLRAEQKQLGRLIPKAEQTERAALLERAGALSAEVKASEVALGEAGAEASELMLALSNIVEEGAPEGGEESFVVLERVGTPREFDFSPRDHVELGSLLGAIDTERAAKVSGAGFSFLTGAGALLELALVNLAIAQAVAAGFTPMITPSLVKPEAMEGTGFLGQAAEEVYRLPDDDLYLMGTSEVALAAYHMDEILDACSLPRRYAGFSACFRREAGSDGRDTRGIIRVYQFDAVEMFTFCAPVDAAAEHRRLLGWEKAFLDQIEVPYRVIDVASGDLGSCAVRKFDCEAWIPTEGGYREVTSTSNCTSFQARRLRVRMREADVVRPLATLNGTLCALPRIIVAILENHQQADGSVVVPTALRPYLGGSELLEPLA